LSLGQIFGLIFGLFVGPTVGLSGALIAWLIFELSIFIGVALGCWSESPLKNGALSGSIVGLINGLMVGLMGGLMVGLFFGLIVGVIVGLTGGLGVGSLNRITLVETISWKWNQFWKRTIPGLIVGLIIGLMGSGELSGTLIGELSYCLSYGLIGGLISGLAGGFTDRVKVDKAYPNQGIKLSRKNSFAVFLVTLPSVGLIFGLISELLVGVRGELSGRPMEWLGQGLIIALTAGLICGLFIGLNRGGSAVIKHYALRLILWRKGYTPFNFIKFLDHCDKLIFLKKVGGGYIFIHRMLLEYFADLPR
jgi:hypothetical protein